MENEPDRSQKEPNQLGIKEFVEDNHKLLSTLGIFLAITIFSTNIDLKSFSPWLSFLSLSCVILLWIELWTKFPKNGGSLRLSLFENAISFLSMLTIIYWVVKVKSLFQSVTILIAFIVMGIISSVLKRRDIFNRLFYAERGSKKILRISIGIALIVFVLYLSFLISSFISPLIDAMLDGLKNAPV